MKENFGIIILLAMMKWDKLAKANWKKHNESTSIVLKSSKGYAHISVIVRRMAAKGISMKNIHQVIHQLNLVRMQYVIIVAMLDIFHFKQ